MADTVVRKPETSNTTCSSYEVKDSETVPTPDTAPEIAYLHDNAANRLVPHASIVVAELEVVSVPLHDRVLSLGALIQSLRKPYN